MTQQRFQGNRSRSPHKLGAHKESPKNNCNGWRRGKSSDMFLELYDLFWPGNRRLSANDQMPFIYFYVLFFYFFNKTLCLRFFLQDPVGLDPEADATRYPPASAFRSAKWMMVSQLVQQSKVSDQSVVLFCREPSMNNHWSSEVLRRQ